MINLLPSKEKEKLLLERKKRIVVILWFLVLFFLFCLILISFLIKIYLQVQVESQKTLLLELEKEFGQSEIRELRKQISSINSTLTKLDSFYQKKIYFSEILEKVSQVLPQEVRPTNLSTVFSLDEEGEKGSVKISLSGFAPTRESLLEFKKNLDQQSDFRDVYFSPENWVKSIDIDFFVTFVIEDYRLKI